jgi:hypothetical protein
MNSRKWAHVCAIVLTLFTVSPLVAIGQEVDFYGYGAERYSTQNGSSPFSLLWAVVGVKTSYPANNLFEGSLVGHIEYDLSSGSTTRVHAKYNVPVGNGTASVLAGQYLSPVSFLHPSPRWIRVPRRTPTEQGVQVDPVGVAGWYSWKGGIVRASLQSRDGSLVASLGGRFRSFYLFGSDAGYGVMYKKKLDEKWANIRVGGVEHTTDRASFDKSAFVKYYVKPIRNTRVYAQLDYHVSGENVGWFFGISYKLRDYWFAGMFVDKTSMEEIYVKATPQLFVKN